MAIFQTIIKILGTAWGVWSIAAFAIGVFLWVTSLVIKKSKPATFDGNQTYRFFRLAMLLAFFLALATLATATIREILASPQGPSKAERIQRLTLDLKSADPTQRRQAAEALVLYGADAAPELVKAITEESSAIASDMMGRAASGDLGDLLSGLLGAPPWQTPFMNSASGCLVKIGGPSTAPILDQLAVDSLDAEGILAEASQHQGQSPQNSLETLGQWRFLLSAAGKGMRIGITRDIFSRILRDIGMSAVPDLLAALESPRLLVRMTSFQALTQIPQARSQILERLQQLAADSTNASERAEYLAAMRQFSNDGSH